MTHYLVTGAAGFIGSHLIEHLETNTDADITGIVSYRHRGCPLRTKAFNRAKLIYADLRAPISDRVAEAIGPVDVIFNLAAESHVDRSIADPVPFIENNVALELNVLEYARRVKPSLLIQISTDEVYGPAEDGVRHTEWSPVLPSNPYAASKAAQEAIAISYWRTYGVPLVLTNTMNNYGERQDPEKFVPMCIARIAKGEEITIHGTPEKIGSRFYLHARNHADALLFLADRPPSQYSDGASQPDRYNVVGDREVSNLDLASEIASLMDRELRYRLEDFHATRPGHDRRYALDGAKLADLGWQAPVEFHESLERTVRWTLAHPEWMA